eukprot:TRINITY_DN30953_c0_g1_i1.p2 TRINITY_DN30953_c0_g1~~TRINITY_DN30953_c0_g1_i1.p2  ORF type:complete len:128 (+),score=24.67 TRINITY_DN30953_c0_g1_i1:51-386(+)
MAAMDIFCAKEAAVPHEELFFRRLQLLARIGEQRMISVETQPGDHDEDFFKGDLSSSMLGGVQPRAGSAPPAALRGLRGDEDVWQRGRCTIPDSCPTPRKPLEVLWCEDFE